MFDLLDYYESCQRLNISFNKNFGIRGWQACSRFIRKVICRSRPIDDITFRLSNIRLIDLF